MPALRRGRGGLTSAAQLAFNYIQPQPKNLSPRGWTALGATFLWEARPVNGPARGELFSRWPEGLKNQPKYDSMIL
jgi:hypothetical protein